MQREEFLRRIEGPRPETAQDYIIVQKYTKYMNVQEILELQVSSQRGSGGSGAGRNEGGIEIVKMN